MEVEELHVLEFGLGRAEQLLAELDVRVHRAADVEEEQHLHGVVPLGDQLQIEIALVGRVLDRAGNIEFDLGTFARPFAQTPERHLDVARAEFDGIVEVLVFALVPDFDGLAVAALVLADAHAFGIVAHCSERRGAARADHLVAAFVALLLLFEALLQRLHELFPAAQRLDHFLFVFGEEFLRQRAQPFFGDLRDLGAFERLRGP